MPITIDLPQVGESVVEGVIGKWLKAPGDRLEKYEALVEVVTDKVTMEVPSPVDGILTRILAEEGTTVLMGAPIAEVETDDAASQTPPRESPVATTPVGVEGPPRDVGTTGYLVKDLKPFGPTGGGMEQGVTEAPPAPPSEATPPREDRARYSPAVRRLASEHAVDLMQVEGTGLGGRITRDDVMKFVESRGAGPPVRVSQSPGEHRDAQVMAEGEEVIALTPVRRIIAQNMVKSATEIPHAWSMVEVDVHQLVRYREAMKEEFQRREGVDLTYLPFVIKAAVDSLSEHPMLNSTWTDGGIVVKKRIHMGIAVAAPEGLIVPVIHDADTLSIAELAKAARELTLKAREGALTLSDVRGGTFTLNNTGALGSIISQPIINYPQAAILTSEAIQKRPVVVDDAIGIRYMMNICLSFDHRIADGAEAGTFLRSVKGRLEAMGTDTPIY